MNTLAAMLRSEGLKAENEGVAIVALNVSPDQLQSCLHALLKDGPPDTLELARSVANKACEKYDLFLTDELLSADYAASKLDPEEAFNTIRRLIKTYEDGACQ